MDRLTDLLGHPGILIAALFSLPLFNLGVAAFLTWLLLAFRRARSAPPVASDRFTDTVAGRYRPEVLTLSIGAIAVIVIYAVENIVRGYVLHLVDIVEWWQYATPVFAVFLVVLLLLVVIALRRRAPETTSRSTLRRTWSSFGSRAALIGTGGVAILLVATTFGAGLASSADDRRRFIYLSIPVPNTDISSLQLWFYGWSFGVPVLVCTALLITGTWAVLHVSAIRPFMRAETVAPESAERSGIATGTALLAAAGMLLALGGAWRFIARSGTASKLGVGDDPTMYDVIWKYAELAALAGWLAPVAEIIGFVLLLLVASRLNRGRARHGDASTSSAATDASVDDLLSGARR
ncbi:hypothetical protein [Agromyces italicus]|uniref:hypothetical protein n=1 Tax=Agromyces italicus TaxID=279572 RepID=UPI0003B62349|nr:hypothetical protein [Agromyces italicus]